MIEAAALVGRKGGKVLLSREFVDLSSEKVYELLAPIPRLVRAVTEHTTSEESGKRYLWEPLDEIYVVIITDVDSNVIQDIKTLRVLSQVTKEIVSSHHVEVASEDEVSKYPFLFIDGFDEVVTYGGLAENLAAAQVQTFLEMESHEEKIQEIIERNKQLEAAEERKNRAKALEMQRKQSSRSMGGGMGSSGFDRTPSSFMAGSSGISVPAASTVPLDVGSAAQEPSRFSAPSSRGAAPKGRSLKLGKAGKTASSTPLLAEPEPLSHRAAPSTASATAATASAKRTSTTTEIIQSETLKFDVTRDGHVRESSVAGQLSIIAGDRSNASLKVHTKIDGPASAYRPHPKMDRQGFADTGVIASRSGEDFPPSQVLLVKYSLNEVPLPLTVSCWVSESSDVGFLTVTLEYDIVSAFEGTLDNVQVVIPLPSPNAHVLDPADVYEQFDDHLIWTIPTISSSSPSGSFEFTAEADSEDDFYPQQVRFTTTNAPFGKISVTSVTDATSGEPVEFTKLIETNADAIKIR